MTKKLFKQLDKRNTGYGIWKYYINRRRPGIGKFRTIVELNQEYYLWREWCWQTWGPSKELPNWLNEYSAQVITPSSQNEHWCWQHDSHVTRIYLRGDEEMTMFVLKWGTNL